jgi:hypothetical protein
MTDTSYFYAFIAEVERLIREAGADPVDVFGRNSPGLTTGRDVNAHMHESQGTSAEAGALAWFTECVKPAIDRMQGKAEPTPPASVKLSPYVVRYCGTLELRLRYAGTIQDGNRQKYMGYILTSDGRRWNFSNVGSGGGAGSRGPTAEDFDAIAGAVVAFGGSTETNADKELASDIGDEADMGDRGYLIRRTPEGEPVKEC